MKSTVALCFTLYVTVFAHTCFVSARQRRQTPSFTTTPPVECVLPQKPQPYNHLDLVCSEFGETENCGSITLEGFIFNATCKEGYSFETTEPSVYTLHVNGSWTPSIPYCRRWCKPLKASSVDVECYNKGKQIECSKYIPVGAIAVDRCKLGHMPTEEASNTLIECKENGQWSRELVRCEVVCGIINSTQRSSLTDSVPPWFAVIYKRNSTVDTPKKAYVGTLISPHLVLTEAYFVYSEKDRRVVSAQTIVVELSKRLVNVRQISIPPRYSGKVLHWALNIAVLDLETSVVTKSDIMPACFDWGHEFDIIPGQSGTRTTLRRSDISISNNPTYAQFEYIDYTSCLNELPTSSHSYVTPEKFCAIYTNRTKLNDFGVAGSGFIFERNGVYYLKGVSSVWLEKSDTRTIMGFTNLSDVGVLDWLQRTKRSFDLNHNST